MPAVDTSKSCSPSPGVGSGRSTTVRTSGPPNSVICTARMCTTLGDDAGAAVRGRAPHQLLCGGARARGPPPRRERCSHSSIVVGPTVAPRTPLVPTASSPAPLPGMSSGTPALTPEASRVSARRHPAATAVVVDAIGARTTKCGTAARRVVRAPRAVATVVRRTYVRDMPLTRPLLHGCSLRGRAPQVSDLAGSAS